MINDGLKPLEDKLNELVELIKNKYSVKLTNLVVSLDYYEATEFRTNKNGFNKVTLDIHMHANDGKIVYINRKVEVL